jgi:hypothetical protein
MLRELSICVTLLLGSGSTAPAGRLDAPGLQRGWVLLGQRVVNDRIDHDVIAVTVDRGDFKSIKLVVERAPVDFHRVVVYFGNDTKQEVEVRKTVPAGGETRVIDLVGKDRVISRVQFWYDAKTIRGRRAAVRLLGRR